MFKDDIKGKEKTAFEQANECMGLLIKLRELKKQNNQEEYMKLRDKLIIKNMRLAIQVANQKSVRSIEGISQEDKEQMAMIGLINAIDKFDPERGLFGNYANIEIYTTILNEAGKNKNIVNEMNKYINKIISMKNEYLITFGREPSKEEILNETGLTEEKLKEIKNYYKLINVESYENANSKYYFKLQNGSDELYDNEILEKGYLDREEPRIMQSENEAIEKNIARKQLKEAINKAIEELSLIEKRVLELYYGINDMQPKTFAQVAKMLDLTESTTKSIAIRALEKLNNQHTDLRDFYDSER